MLLPPQSPCRWEAWQGKLCRRVSDYENQILVGLQPRILPSQNDSDCSWSWRLGKHGQWRLEYGARTILPLQWGLEPDLFKYHQSNLYCLRTQLWWKDLSAFFSKSVIRSRFVSIFPAYLDALIRWKGIQIMNDTSSFGAFINSFIASLRDESLKIPCLIIPLLSDAVSRSHDVNDVGHFLHNCNCRPYYKWFPDWQRHEDDYQWCSLSAQSPWAFIYEYSHSISIRLALRSLVQVLCNGCTSFPTLTLSHSHIQHC